MRFQLLFLAAALSVAAQPRKTYEYFHLGKTETPRVHGAGGYLLGGGGRIPEDALRWFVRRAEGGEIVTLRASGGDAVNQAMLDAGAAAASTLLFNDLSAAFNEFVLGKLSHASAVFLAGGDQSRYVDYWKGSPVNETLDQLIAEGTPVGGSSAGVMILAQFGFSAAMDTITSKQALADPFDPAITICDDFVHIPLLEGIITDTHFARRDRMGRTLVFLARLVHDGKARPASGIAVDEGAAVLLRADGRAELAGSGHAYFIRTTGHPEVFAPQTPLTFRDISVYRIDREGSFDVKTWRGEGGTAYTVNVEAGEVRSTQPGGAIY